MLYGVRVVPQGIQLGYVFVACRGTNLVKRGSQIEFWLLTFRMTCDGSVLSMAFKYCCIALSYSPFWYKKSPYFQKWSSVAARPFQTSAPD